MGIFNVDLKDRKIFPTDKKLAGWRSSKTGGDSSIRPRRLSVDGRIGNAECMVDREFARARLSDVGGASTSTSFTSDDSFTGGGMMHHPNDGSFIRGSPIRIPKVVKKQGESISKGHKNYELMLNLQLGIR